MVLRATQKEPMYKLGILLYDATKERGRNVENVWKCGYVKDLEALKNQL